ncbi:hypothetical protein H312_01950 [Anncaliia algerae PRA339]|uniref:phosphomevalonate kinase n=1 Tax=Anncaliia algerae PRA339 TaxID=1288291 RepID=A0A059F0W5_9MICR|nr:hypothetical protein H312_01950 [Anncaliia algerae PRA339]
MTTLTRKCFKVPGKVVINGGYLVCFEEEGACLTVDSYLNVNYSHDYSDKFTFNLEMDGNNINLSFESDLYKSNVSKDNYLVKIVKEFYKFTSITPKGAYKVNLLWDDGFFYKNVKLGLGSSACLVVGIVKILFDSNKVTNYSFLDLVKSINQYFSPFSSGIDVTSCYKGNIFYSKKGDSKLRCNKTIMLLGTMLKSTDTKENLKFINQKEKFNSLKEINSKIIKLIKVGAMGTPELKMLYKEYLCELKKISQEIVPLYQYSVLMNTFDMDIIGCGVSGSGGEDAVWCLVTEREVYNVLALWNNKFSYVKKVTVPEKSGLIEL